MKKLHSLLALGILAAMPSSLLSAFKAPSFLSVPNPLVGKDDDEILVSAVNDRLTELERQFNKSMGTSSTNSHSDHVDTFEGRLNDLQEQLDGVTSLKADNDETKQIVAQLASRVEAVEMKLSTVSEVKSGLDDLETKVNANFDETKETIENLQAEVETFKRTNDDFENRMQIVQQQLASLSSLGEDHEGTKQKITLIANRLETVENDLSSVANVKKDLDDLQVEVTADSEDKKKKIEKLQLDLKKLKTQIQGTETDITAINTDIENLKKLHEKEEVPSSVVKECPQDYHYNARVDLCIKYFSTPMNMPNARTQCATIGSQGGLAVLDTRDKQKAAVMYLYDKLKDPKILLGGEKVADKYYWNDGKMIDSNSWCPGHPQMLQCVMLGLSDQVCYLDMPCGIEIPFLCQITLNKG